MCIGIHEASFHAPGSVFTLKVPRRYFHYQPHTAGGEILHERAILEQLKVNGSPLTAYEWGVVNYRQSKQ